jgi:hypothetical protein
LTRHWHWCIVSQGEYFEGSHSDVQQWGMQHYYCIEFANFVRSSMFSSNPFLGFIHAYLCDTQFTNVLSVYITHTSYFLILHTQQALYKYPLMTVITDRNQIFHWPFLHM